MSEQGKTSYETEPIDGHAGAVYAFAEAYNVLQKTLHESDDEFSLVFADALRVELTAPCNR